MGRAWYSALSIAPATGNESYASSGRPTGLGLIFLLALVVFVTHGQHDEGNSR